MKFGYKTIPEWPPLAWLAECSSGDETIRVYHGQRIETTAFWFCEAAWDGNFSAGDFDNTDIVSGSGARLRSEGLWFISSGSNVDRLHSFQSGDSTLVSNSLCCLLAWLGGSLDLVHRPYSFESYRFSIFGDHERIVPSSVGPVTLTYFRNLLWNGAGLSEHEKPFADRDFDSFEGYRAFLSSCLSSISANAQDTRRVHPYRVVCSISNGYDSPTIAALARQVPGISSFTFDYDRKGQDDSGKFIADELGIPCEAVDHNSWRHALLPEVPFLACSGSIGDLAFQSAEKHLSGSVYLTGAAGGSVWKKRIGPTNNPEIGDGCMLGFAEYRLWTSFIHCPVPLLGIRQLSQIISISSSTELDPWMIGGNYDRPICRRIVEEAGIPRNAFGIKKKGVSVNAVVQRDALLPASRADFLQWLADRRTSTAPVGTSPPSPLIARLLDSLLSPVSRIVRSLEFRSRRPPIKSLTFVGNGLRSLQGRLVWYYHHKYLVHWAIDRAIERYATMEGSSSSSQTLSKVQRTKTATDSL